MPINANAAPAKGGERGIEKVWTAFQYTAPTPVSSTELAISKVASTYGLPLATSKVVCELAGLGGVQ